ncbi:LamG domain-containing protein [Conexibacter woesei]|uniref:LamG-like jellyroll fold domain-containing protein n=1 Tax=Conexibacter woesei (strain DSM 14684 / CCUG 47730 / CIP 108061 / JCM 11494 / NBRC 100937 / ID131577) TaxID=469383 RepID=D3F820_CONWI|nr:LamG domain-containing protein [Conexibacter woesei]ADB52914.1 hypothetical protein Cwoe_4501 [Conexibacter woesei DSM 14684]
MRRERRRQSLRRDAGRVWQSHLIGDPDGVVAPAPGTESFALAIWVKPRTLDGNSRRIGGHEQQEGGWFVAARSDRLTFSRYQRLPLGTAWSTVTINRGLPLDRWSFVVAAYGTDRVMRLYVDGAEAGRLESNLQLPPTPPPVFPDEHYPDRGRLVLGASGRTWSASDPSSRMYLEWDGALDEAAVYRRTATPTAAQVRRLWEVGTAVSSE